MRRLPAENLRYVKIDNLSQIDSKLADLSKFQLLSFSMPSTLGSEPWFFVHPDLKSLRDRMVERFGTIEHFGKSMSINVGLQVLYKKFYLIRGRIEKNKVIGQNYAGIPVSIEKSICRPLAINRKFYPFKVIEKDNFVLFPYQLSLIDSKKKRSLANLKCDAIKFTALKETFPKTWEYLKESKEEIQDKVETKTGVNWYHYTYEKNHCLQSLPKMLIPSTCLDTTATVDALGEFYQDNVRVNSIIIDGADVRHYKALAAIFNSRIFDCLAKITAESLDNGYIQLNKQFLLPVPLPVQRLLDEVEVTDSLASVYDEMQSVISAYVNASDKETREALKIALSSAEENLNSLVNTRVYELNDQDVQELQRFGKRLPIGSYVDQTLREVGELDFVEEAEAV
ncbi:hypothetical protein [Bdellovibrio bacteriovorus]|uniref:site-specific DNA-methyltransferase (adenine-specific) n=1 Tax=Bdellovibrio bacteriovorus TaxID=959 RepID=A0A1Z3N6C3_BDEBC|nr:hypothetical protein [Bdellovibrio bacteriovorus]ASD63030.1 hypothetical protein B9G79_05325 [Bdellovibrio bacteriovorus]